jgi:hypothetical protein
METLSALELIAIGILIRNAISSPNIARFHPVYKHIDKRLNEELQNREINEIIAALEDLKRIDPEMGQELKPSIDLIKLMAEMKKAYGR